MTNVAASVRSRLTTQAQRAIVPFQEVLQNYALERFLYRLAQSQHRGRFILKGALLFKAWGTAMARPTRDIDLLGFVSNEIALVESMLREVCDLPVEDDGLRFDPTTLVGIKIKEDAEYHGIRVTFRAFLDRSWVPMQLDIGFGDVVHPEPQELEYPTLLPFSPARLRMYPREAVIAEKFHAMVHLGRINSRMKDFFDVWLLSQKFDFEGPVLAEAIRQTFEHRATALDLDPVALTPSFTAAPTTQQQWVSFIKRSRLDSAPRNLDDLRAPLRSFLLPLVAAILEDRPFDVRWSIATGWQ